MNGAEKIFIHGEEIAKQKDLERVRNDAMNTAFNEAANVRNELNQRIDNVPVIYPQDLVSEGFDYAYEDTTVAVPVTVEVVPYGSGAGFTLQDDGYYHADNVGVDQSYAMAKVIFHNESDVEQPVHLDIHQVAEQGCDYFVKSFLNTDLEDSINDSMNVEEWFNNEGNAWRESVFSVPAGDSYITIKYRKDSNVNAADELARFRAFASYPIISERRHMATREDSDFIKIEVETGLSGVLNPTSNIANVNLKPEESKFEELIALVRKGIYKNIVLTDGIYTCFMCLEEVTEEEITYINLHPIKNGARGRYYRALNFNFDEAGVLTTLTLSRHGERFLTTSETGSWELSNYTPVYKKYVDDTINEVTDEKLAGVVPNDLLHYKGHVDTIEDLPTLGQTSASKPTSFTAPSYNGINVGRRDANLSAYDVNAGPSTLYYVVGRYKETSNSTPEGCFCLKTNNPEVIRVVRYDANGHSIGIVVQYHADRPVYWSNKQAGPWETLTSDRMFMVYDGALRTNFPLKTPTWIPGNITSTIAGNGYSSNVTHKYRNAQAVNPDTSLTYYYDPGYIVMVPESDTSDYAKLYFGDSLAKHKDVYTVGENNDIYYCNTLQEWELWSKAPEGSASSPTVYYLDRWTYAKDAPEILAVAQEIYDRIMAGDKNILVVYTTTFNSTLYTNVCYYSETVSNENMLRFTGTFSVPEPDREKEGYTQIALYRMLVAINATDGVVTEVSNSHNWADMGKVLAITNTPTTPYIATEPWHPASKQYADNVSKVIKQVETLPEREWVTWDNTSDLSGKTVKITRALHDYSLLSYNPETFEPYTELLFSDNGYSLAINNFETDDEGRKAWVLLKDYEIVNTIAYISEFEYEDYVFVDNTFPDDVGVLTSEKLGTSEMPDALTYLGGYPQDYIYQIGTVFYISTGAAFIKLVTEQ